METENDLDREDEQEEAVADLQDFHGTIVEQHRFRGLARFELGLEREEDGVHYLDCK